MRSLSLTSLPGQWKDLEPPESSFMIRYTVAKSLLLAATSASPHQRNSRLSFFMPHTTLIFSQFFTITKFHGVSFTSAGTTNAALSTPPIDRLPRFRSQPSLSIIFAPPETKPVLMVAQCSSIFSFGLLKDCAACVAKIFSLLDDSGSQRRSLSRLMSAPILFRTFRRQFLNMLVIAIQSICFDLCGQSTET